MELETMNLEFIVACGTANTDLWLEFFKRKVLLILSKDVWLLFYMDNKKIVLKGLVHCFCMLETKESKCLEICPKDINSYASQNLTPIQTSYMY